MDNKGFAHGHAVMKLSEYDVAKAVEFWLNQKVLRVPCEVKGMVNEDKRTFGTQAFEVELREIVETDE